MIIKLSSIDVVQITKALKYGWLDLSKIESFKSLVEGYNPPKTIDDKELNYYKDCLFKAIGYVPTPSDEFKKGVLSELNSDQLAQWEECIKDGRMYNEFVRNAFIGIVALRALGGTYEDVKPDYSFIEEGLKEKAQTKENNNLGL